MLLIDLVQQDSRIKIDADDLEKFKYWLAYVIPHSSGRFNLLVRNDKRELGTLGQFILELKGSGFEVDHENGDSLDCRRTNLRKATRLQNSYNRKIRSDNSTGYKGVTYDESTGLYEARISANCEPRRLGRFTTAVEAALAYDAAARKYHGEFARLNFPEGE